MGRGTGIGLVLVGVLALFGVGLAYVTNRADTRSDAAHRRSMYRLQASFARIGSSPQAREDLENAERAFMQACRKCASAQECERDRLVIAAGRATDSYNPCD